MSRYLVVGAGAVGGVIGARLSRAGFEVELVARGAHLAALRARGLRLRSPEGDATLAVSAVAHPAEHAFGDDSVVLLAVKTQDAEAALAELASCAGSETPVVCLQNGVEAERLALRRFARVVGAMLMLPTTHLEPGVVVAHSAPTPGVGRRRPLSERRRALTKQIAADLRLPASRPSRARTSSPGSTRSC